MFERTWVMTNIKKRWILYFCSDLFPSFCVYALYRLLKHELLIWYVRRVTWAKSIASWGWSHAGSRQTKTFKSLDKSVPVINDFNIFWTVSKSQTQFWGLSSNTTLPTKQSHLNQMNILLTCCAVVVKMTQKYVFQWA